MQVLLILLLSIGALAVLAEVVELYIDAWRPQLLFGGLNLIASFHLRTSARPDSADRGKVFSTGTARYQVRSSSELAFRARTSFMVASWPFRASVKLDGANWFVELRAALRLWLMTAALVLLWVIVTWGLYAADGVGPAMVPFLFGLAGYAIYRAWIRRQPARALAMAAEIAEDIAGRTESPIR